MDGLHFCFDMDRVKFIALYYKYVVRMNSAEMCTGERESLSEHFQKEISCSFSCSFSCRSLKVHIIYSAFRKINFRQVFSFSFSCLGVKAPLPFLRWTQPPGLRWARPILCTGFDRHRIQTSYTALKKHLIDILHSKFPVACDKVNRCHTQLF